MKTEFSQQIFGKKSSYSKISRKSVHCKLSSTTGADGQKSRTWKSQLSLFVNLRKAPRNYSKTYTIYTQCIVCRQFFGRLSSWTFQSLPVTWCANSLTFNNCTFCTHCIYVFCIFLSTNNDLFHLQYKLIGFYNRDEKCLLRGTNWVFK